MQEPVLGQPRRFLLVLSGDPAVDGVVEPGGENHGAWRVSRFSEQVQGLQDGQQVGAAVVLPVFLAPAVQQVQEQGVVAGQHGVPAVQERHLEGLATLAGGDAESAGNQLADQDPGLHGDGTGLHQGVVPGLGDVVMVAVERPLRNAGCLREAVQLVEGGVRDQV
ncbi:hypothetical protein D9M72_519580 [compost metagenome]